MTDLPTWLQAGLTNPKVETIGPRIRLRGHSPYPNEALEDFYDVLACDGPPGFVLSRASIEAEHARGKRLNWEVVWLREEVAERRYEERQATRLSRFEVNS